MKSALLVGLSLWVMLATPAPAVVVVVRTLSPGQMLLPSIPTSEPELPATSIEEEFLKPPPIVAPAETAAYRIGDDGKLIRLPGPQARWPHQGCLMCLGIHLERTHRVPNDYLAMFGHAQWDVLHSNLHNEKSQPVVPAEAAIPPSQTPPAITPPAKPDAKSGGCSGGVCPSPSRAKWRGIFR